MTGPHIVKKLPEMLGVVAGAVVYGAAHYVAPNRVVFLGFGRVVPVDIIKDLAARGFTAVMLNSLLQGISTGNHKP